MFEYSINNLQWLIAMLDTLPISVYTMPSSMLSGATVGQHLRHIVEMYQALLSGYDTGEIAYDRRKRDRSIETDISVGQNTIKAVMAALERPDKQLQVISDINQSEFILQSNYQREVMYNLEHSIHHMALIKVAILELTDIVLPDQFGVAPTTLQYRSQCAQ